MRRTTKTFIGGLVIGGVLGLILGAFAEAHYIAGLFNI